MTLYEATKHALRARFDYQRVAAATSNPLAEPDSESMRQEQNQEILNEVFNLSLGALLRLDALDNPLNDQAQAMAKELTKQIGKQINFNFSKLGIPFLDE